jgi:predicted nucleic acid-binding protein
MSFLVDANVLSEPTKPAPELKVLHWLRGNESEIVVNPIILGEIRFGIERMPPGRRRQRFEDWFRGGVEKLVCVPFEAASGICWARLLARLHANGKQMPLKDSLIAATALEYGFVVVTRNIRDFHDAGVKVVDPFA